MNFNYKIGKFNQKIQNMLIFSESEEVRDKNSILFERTRL